MDHYSNPNPCSLEVRPGFCVLGAMLALFVSYIEDSSIYGGTCPGNRLFSTEKAAIGQLGLGKVPDHMQGPLDAMGHLLFALAVIYVAWRLLTLSIYKPSRSE